MAMPFLKFITLALSRGPGVGVVAYVVHRTMYSVQLVVCMGFGWLYGEIDGHLVWDIVLTTGWCEELGPYSCTEA